MVILSELNGLNAQCSHINIPIGTPKFSWLAGFTDD